MESGALITAVLGAAACGHKSIWRRSPLPPLPHHSLASGQTTGREHSSTHQQNYLLVYYYFLLSFSFYLFFFHPNHCGWISTTGPYVHKRPNIISPINHKEMQIQTTMKSYHPHVRMAIIKNTRNTYMWNLEKWYRWTYLQNRNRDLDVENKCMDTKLGGGNRMGDWDWHIDTTIETEQDPIIFPFSPPLISSVFLLSVENFSQRINLIREMRNAKQRKAAEETK